MGGLEESRRKAERSIQIVVPTSTVSVSTPLDKGQFVTSGGQEDIVLVIVL